MAYPFAGDAERRPLPQDASIDAYAHHNGISGVKDELRQNSQLYRKHRHVPEDRRAVRGRGLVPPQHRQQALAYLNSSCLAFLYSSLYLVKESNRW